jgi:hypothetical protein
MTEPYARPADDARDDTIPLVPEAGFAPTEQLPFAEETLIDPLRTTSPWSPAAQVDITAPGYGSGAATYGSPSPVTLSAFPPPGTYPGAQAGDPRPAPAQPVAPQTNYVQPVANYAQPQPMPAPAPRPDQAGFAEPSGPADTMGAQNIYQGYPTTAYGQQPPAWPAVIPDPVGFDFGYSRPAPASDHPNAILSLVLGIVGILFFQLLSPVAWFLAAKGRREMATYPGRWRNSGSLTAGLVLGILGTVLLGVVAIGVLLFVALIAVSAG